MTKVWRSSIGLQVARKTAAQRSASLRMKVLRSVLAAGVLFVPFGHERAFADGNIVRTNDTANLIAGGVADIYAADAHEGVGLNKFQHFEVGNNQIANLYFHTAEGSPALNTLVNTVENRISISGTVNAVRDNKIGGNLYFISPQGMVVGAGGVINAGSLTMITSSDTFSDAQAAAGAVNKNSWNVSSTGSIDINGTINTAAGIDLRAATINVATASGGAAPLLQTGAVFENIVQLGKADQKVNVSATERLQLEKVGDNYVLKLPDGTTDYADASGDGSIKLAASASAANAKQEFLGVTTENTAQAKVDVGTGATIDAVGNVSITAEAERTNASKIASFWDFFCFADAEVSVDGKIKGKDITISSTATTKNDAGNYANIAALINESKIPVTDSFAKMLTDQTNKVAGLSIGANHISNLLNQVYMPFSLTKTNAVTKIGSSAVVEAGGKLSVSAASTATNTMKVAIQPKIQGEMPAASRYAAGGFIYEQSDTGAVVNVDGKLSAVDDLKISAEAKSTASSNMSVSNPTVYKEPQSADGSQAANAAASATAPVFAVGIGVVSLDTQAAVNLGSEGNIASTGGKVDVNAKSTNFVSSSVSVAGKDETALSTGINIVTADGSAVINNYAHLEGKSVSLKADEEVSKFTVSTGSNIGTDYSGVDYVLHMDIIQDDVLKPIFERIAPATGSAAGSNVQPSAQASGTSWSEYFDMGASIAVASAKNSAVINLGPGASVNATGDVDIAAAVTIADSSMITKNNVINNSDNNVAGVSAAVGVENFSNEAVVNLAAQDKEKETIKSSGSVTITAQTEQRYNRPQALVDSLLTAFDNFKKYWTDWSTDTEKAKKIQAAENIIADIVTLADSNSPVKMNQEMTLATKANAAISLITDITGTDDIKKALLAFLDPANYANMHASTKVANNKDQDVTARLAASVAVQNWKNAANANIGAKNAITAGEAGTVKIGAAAVEQNVLLAGKASFIPQLEASGTEFGVGGSVGVQNADTESMVRVENGVKISAGNIEIDSENDILNLALIFAGSETSKLGLTGMVSYMGGTANAGTLVDDDVIFNAKEELRLDARNDANVISLVGDLMLPAGGSPAAVGASVGVISYDVNTLAKLENLEDNDSDTKGSITAESVSVSAETGGTINNFTVAGIVSNNKNKQTENTNADGGGVQVAQNGTDVLEQNVPTDNGAATNAGSAFSLKAAGSVSRNYIGGETHAALDNVIINLQNENSQATSVQVQAEDKAYIGAYSGAMALNMLGNGGNQESFSGTLTGAVGYNNLKKDTYADLAGTVITAAGTGTAPEVESYAHNSGAQVAAGLSLGVETGKRAGGVDINLGASASVNKLQTTVQSSMKNNNITAANSAVRNLAYDQDVQVAGGVTVEVAKATASVGAAVSVNEAANNIQAVMAGNTLGSAAAFLGSVDDIAASKVTQVGAAVSVGVGTGSQAYVVADVAVNNNKLANDVGASVDGGTIYAQKFSSQAVDGTLSFKPEDDNAYLTSLNTLPTSTITVDKDGDYYQNGTKLSTAFAVYDGDTKNYVVCTMNDLVYDSSEQQYKTADGKRVDIYDRIYKNGDGKDVDVTAAERKQQDNFDLTGSEALANANGTDGQGNGITDVDLDITDGTDNAGAKKYTNTSIALGNNGSTIVGTALGLGVLASSESQADVAAAAAASINNVQNNFNASVSNASVITVSANEEAFLVNAFSDTRMINVAAGVAVAVGGQESVGIAAAGSGIKQSLSNNTTATVENSTLQSDNASIKAASKSTLVSVSGQVSVETSAYGVAAGLTWAENSLDNSTGAYARGIDFAGYSGAGAFALAAENEMKTWAVAVGTSVSAGNGAFEGAYASNHGTNSTEAIVEQYDKDSKIKKNTFSNIKNLGISASDASSAKAVAGTVAAGTGNVTLGGAVAQNTIGSAGKRQHVSARLNDASITVASDGAVNVDAQNSANLFTLSLGGAIGAGSSMFGISAQGNAATTTLYQDTDAEMNGVTLDNNSKAVSVDVSAESSGSVKNSADAVGVGINPSAGITVAATASVGKVYSDADTTAKIADSNLKAGDIIAQASSDNSLLNVGIGLGVGVGVELGADVVANVATNQIANDTDVIIDNSTLDATGSVGALAHSAEKLRNYGGGVSVSVGGSTGVALGATVVTNTISGSTGAAITKSSITALGDGDGIKIDEHTAEQSGTAGSDAVKDYQKYEIKTSENTQKGLVVDAAAEHELRDISITGGVAIGGAAGIAADATTVINKISGATFADVSATSINASAADLSKADVYVHAYDNADISSHIGTLAVAPSGEVSVSAAGAGDRNTLARETRAKIAGEDNNNMATLRAQDLSVDALGASKIYISESGAAVGVSMGGSAAVTGSVSVNRYAGSVAAQIANVDAGVHTFGLHAENLQDLAAYNNAITISGGIGSGSVSVAVTDVKDASSTNAAISNAEINVNDAADSKAEIGARNNTQLDAELSGDALAVSIGGASGTAVGNINAESKAGVSITDSVLGAENAAFADVAITADNNVYAKYTNVADAASTVISAAVGTGVLNINTGTDVALANAKIFANNIALANREQRTVDTKMAGVDIGGLGAGVNVMHTNIGSTLQDTYAYDEDDGQSQYDTSATQAMVNDALARMNTQADKAKNISGDASIDHNNATIDKGTASGGNNNTLTNTDLQASGTLTLDARSTTNTDISVKQASIAILNVAVAANRLDVEDNLAVKVAGSTLAAKTIAIASLTDGELKAYLGQGGFSAATYADATANVKHHGTNSISVDGSTLHATGSIAANENGTSVNPLRLQAVNTLGIDNSGLGVAALEGISAGRLVLQSEDAADVSISLNKDNTLQAAGSTVLAQNAPKVYTENEDVTGLALLAGKGSIASAKANGTATLSVDASNTFDGSEVGLLAQTGGADYLTTEAINHSVGVSGVGAVFDKARAYNNMSAQTTVGAATFINGENAYANVSIGAENAAQAHAEIFSTQVGAALQVGSNYAQTKATSKAEAYLDAGSGIKVNKLNLYANNSDSITGEARGNSASIVASVNPELAKAENVVNATTTAKITGKIEAAGSVYVGAVRKDVTDLKADGLTVAVGGGGGSAVVDNSAQNNTQVNLENAVIDTAGSLTLESDNSITLNRTDGFDTMVKATAGGIFTGEVAKIDNEITAAADINLDKSILNSDGGMLLKSYNKEDFLINSYVLGVGLVTGAEGKTVNTINNAGSIKLADSSLKTSRTGSDMTLSASDDVKLFAYVDAETRSIAVTGANAVLKNNLGRSNSIDLSEGANTLYSTRDINLYAGMRSDGNLAMLDLDTMAVDYADGLIPVPVTPTVNNAITQSNQINVGAASMSNSVRHTNLYADQGREMEHVTANSYCLYKSKENESFVSTDNGDAIKGQTANNSVRIDGSVVAGIANKINITIGEAGDIVILDEETRATVENAKNYDEIKLDVQADASTGLSKDSLTFASENYATTLYQRYEQLLDLMHVYEEDKDGNDYSAAYYGYKAEAERVLTEMLDLGLVKQNADGSLTVNSMTVDYVEIPELAGSGGNITVDSASLIGSGTMKAQGTPEISITNNTNLMTKVNAISVEDPGGKFIFNNSNLSAGDTAVFNAAINALNADKQAKFADLEAAEGQDGQINITGNYNGAEIPYSGTATDEVTGEPEPVSGTLKPMADIHIQGNIYSKEGNVSITSAHNSIIIEGKTVQDAVSISGKEVSIVAENGNVIQGYTDGIVNIGADVKELYDAAYQQAIKDNSEITGTKNVEVAFIPTEIDDGSEASGSYIAGGSVYINAADINVNGVIQSGFGTYYADISDEVTKSRIQAIDNAYKGGAISDSVVTTGERYKIIDGGAYWNTEQQCYQYRLNVYYNPSDKTILVQNVDAAGGRIYLTGRISSTGNGRIVCLDGASDITVNNTTNYALQLGDLVARDTSGLVSITDTVQHTLTEITSSKVTVKDISDKEITIKEESDYNSGYAYKPQSGLRYTWTSGKKVSTFNRYEKDFGKGGWGMWSTGVSSKDLEKWMEENPTEAEEALDPNGSGSGTNPRAAGEVVRTETSEGSYVQITGTVISDETVKESERKWSSGLWGFNKHDEIIWTRETGKLYAYDASIRADYDIPVAFVGAKDAESVITINSEKDITMTGNIGNTTLYEANGAKIEKGTVNITSSNGSLIQSGGALYGANINLSAFEDMQDIKVVAGDSVNLSAVHTMNAAGASQDSIAITVDAGYLAQGNVVLGQVGTEKYGTDNAITGQVQITTTGKVGNITQESGKTIIADRIDLASTNGAVYGKKNDDGTYSALQIYAGQQPLGSDSMDASVNVTAEGDISLQQVAGDMRIGSIISNSGDVTIEVPNGSVDDALPYDETRRGDEDDLLARWKRIGVIAGNDDMQAAKDKAMQAAVGEGYTPFDQYALLYAIQDSVVNASPDNLPQTSEKDPNIIAHNITISVSDSVGLNSGQQKKIDTSTLLAKDESGNYINLDDLKALAKADASTVTWEKDGDNEHSYAIITETLPIGVQLKAKNNEQGKLTVQTTANAEAQNVNGDIYIQGREQVTTTGVSKDLQIAEIKSQIGNVTLSSLGSITDAADAGAAAITAGKKLYLTAAGGSIGTQDKPLTTLLLSTSEEEGLGAVATNGVYINNLGSNGLRVLSVSSGGDIVLGSNTDITMAAVNGTDAVNYIHAENGGEIILEARGGSIGEADENGDRDKNNGVRILNAKDESGTQVTLRAAEDIYVTGVASTDGTHAAPSGPAGVLNLTLEGKNARGTTELTNVGISVDGALNLQNEVQTLETASVYSTDNLTIKDDQLITSPDTYFGSGKDLTVYELDGLMGNDKLTLAAAQAVNVINEKKNLELVEGISISGNDVNLQAGKVAILLNGGSITAAADASGAGGKVSAVGNAISMNGSSVQAASAEFNSSGDILLTSGSLIADAVALNASGGKIEEAADGFVLQTPELDASARSSITLDSTSNQLEQVTLANKAGDVRVGSANAQNANALDVATNGTIQGALIITNYADDSKNKNAISFSKNLEATGDITITNEEHEIEVNSGASISGNNVTLKAADIHNDYYNDVNIKGGTIAANNKLSVEGKNITSAGNLSANKIKLDALDDDGFVNVNGGSMSASDIDIHAMYSANMSGGKIAGYRVDVNAENVNISGGTLDATNWNAIAGNIMSISDGVMNAEVIDLDAGLSFITSGGSVTAAKQMEVAAHDNITLAGGKLESGTMSLGSQEIAQKYDNTAAALNGGYLIADELTLGTYDAAEQTNFTIDLGSRFNQLAKVNIGEYAEGDIKIGSGNAQAKDLEIAFSNPAAVLQANLLDVHNYANGIANKILLNSKLQLAGDLVLINDEANIEIGDGGTATALSAKNITMISAADIVHNGGSITATGADAAGGTATLQAARNILLQSGTFSAQNATLEADGFVDEYYNNDADTGYALEVSGILTAMSEAHNAEDEYGLDLGSKFNKLANVRLSASKGNVILGNGNTGNTPLDVAIAEKAQPLAGDIIIHNYDVDSTTMSNPVTVSGLLQATGSVEIINDEGNIHVQNVENAEISGRDVTLTATGNISNANQITSADFVTMEAEGDILNKGKVEAQKDIKIVSEDGIIFNTEDADLLSGGGNVSLLAQSKDGEYYYFGDDGLAELPDGTTLEMNDEGQYVATVNGNKVKVVKNGSIFNAGDIMAHKGDITLKSEAGNVTNYDDFNSLTSKNEHGLLESSYLYNGLDIATGNITISAAQGHVYNSHDLEAGENVSLTAAQGLDNFAYNIYAGENITLTATQGDVVNTSVLESYAGDVTLSAANGNVINGEADEPGTGDIITLCGTVRLLANGTDSKGVGYDVVNYGDIIAIGRKTEDGYSGSIELRSAKGDVYNYDNFNTLDNSDEKYLYEYKAENHGSLTSEDASYNVATGNIKLSAINGKIVNNKDYLVAQGDVTLVAREGVGEYGQMILAGGDINLCDTDGLLVNRAELISVEGDINLGKVELPELEGRDIQVTVVNMLDANVIAMNGNVNLYASAPADDTVRLVGISTNPDNPLPETISGIPEGSIIVTKKFYKQGDVVTELVEDAVVPAGATVQTEIGYLDAAHDDAYVAVQPIDGDVEAYRTGDVVNRGDVVALNPDNAEGKGYINFLSDNGNLSNYDNFDILDGTPGQIAYKGASGYDLNGEKVRFNAGTEYYYDDHETILSDADLSMIATKGYLYNTMNMDVKKSLTLISGKDMTVGTNFDSITAGGEVTLESLNGSLKTKDGTFVKSTGSSVNMSGYQGVFNTGKSEIIAKENIAVQSAGGGIVNDGTLSAEEGSIMLDSQGQTDAHGGISSNAPASKMEAVNGSISAVATYGEVNIGELLAGDVAVLGTKEGNIRVDSVTGNDVLLFTESASANIIANTITVGEHLVLRGNSFQHEVVQEDGTTAVVDGMGRIERENATGELVIDAAGVSGAGADAAMAGVFELTIDGDVRFTTLDVTNADITVNDGELNIDRLHVAGAAHFKAMDYVTGVYGVAPHHDASNVVYFDLGKGKGGSGDDLPAKVEDYRVVKEGEPPIYRPLNTMKLLKERLRALDYAAGTPAENTGWMNLYVDGYKHQRSNGLLLHIDTGYRSSNQRWSAEDLSAKLTDFQPQQSYQAHYGDYAGIFARHDLLDIAPQPLSVLSAADSGDIVLKFSDEEVLLTTQTEEDEERRIMSR